MNSPPISYKNHRFPPQIIARAWKPTPRERDENHGAHTTGLRELASRWATSTLLHRTRIIDRFLDHLRATGAIDHNPVEALREACHIKQSMPIWRALISCNPEEALIRLRQPKPFDSVLGEVMAEHVAMMRRRGYKYTSQSVRLLEFDRFLQLNPLLEAEPLSVMIDQWAATKGARNHAYERENLERLFAKIQRRRDPSTPRRRPDPRPKREIRKQWRKLISTLPLTCGERSTLPVRIPRRGQHFVR